MHPRLLQVAPVPIDGHPDFGEHADLSLEGQVQNGLNLFLRMKNPAQMPSLLKAISANADAVHDALKSLHYVHSARFLPSLDGAYMMVITVYDGDLDSYLMDFVAVLGDIFNVILGYIQDAPRLPVQSYARDFCDFVRKNNLSQVGVWSAYPSMTVIDILRAGPDR